MRRRRRSKSSTETTEPTPEIVMVPIEEMTDSEVQRALLGEQIETNALLCVLIDKVDDLDGTVTLSAS